MLEESNMMKPLLKLALKVSLIAVPLVSGTAIAGEECVRVPGYVTDCSGVIVRTDNPRLGINECWHTSEWTPEMAVIGCDGKVAEVAIPPVVFPEPAPEPVPETRVEHITLGAETLFATAKANLSPNGMAKLDEFSEKLRTFNEVESVVVTGHTDYRGSDSYNMNLSQRRADTVRDYLVDRQAVAQDRIETRAMGESDPVVDCTGVSKKRLAACLAPNRRVVIDVTGTSMPQEVQY
jgi:OOP family OmpA-OmpF porin